MKTVMVVLLAIAVGTTIAANVWKRDLRIAHVRTEGNRIVGENEILDLAAIPKNGKLYAVDLSDARLRVKQNPFVKTVSVNREAPDGVSITVTERVPIAAIVLDRLLYLDVDGFVLPLVRSEGVSDLPVLTGDLPAAACIPGKRIISANVLDALEILATARMIGEELYRLISEVHIDGDRDIVLYTSESGVPVVFGRGDAAMKLLKFDGFWKAIVTQRGAGELRTVDLRYADQVVVRWMTDDEPVAQ